MFWKPTVAIQADVASFIVELSQGLKGYKCDRDWIDSLKNKDKEKEESNRYPTPYIPIFTSFIPFWEIPKRVIGKQCRPRSDSTECGI